MQTDKSVERPLHSLRVIEFEGIGPGPLAGRMLSDMGAHVIVVARPTCPSRKLYPRVAVMQA
jgi:alpha-methylacyl-CoA racemase